MNDIIFNKKSLQSVLQSSRCHGIGRRISAFNKMISVEETTYLRVIDSPTDREVLVRDARTGNLKKMLMFASNNYLGLANHPYVKVKVKEAIDQYGAGIGGPPLLNGYTSLIKETEERLADFKAQPAAILFSSGFMANLGAIQALAQSGDLIIYDEYSHASFYDALKLSKAKTVRFRHNQMNQLESVLLNHRHHQGQVYVCLEGVYSMDGDIAPLDKVVQLTKKYNAILYLDDAHGTGVLGEKGKGTADFFNAEADLTLGTFSKAFASCGGFLTGSKEIIDYIRFQARSYIFSASIPPAITAAVLAGLDVIENEPWLRLKLMDNVKYTVAKLKPYGFWAEPGAAIVALKLADDMNVRKAARLFHDKNIFINPIEYPAVRKNQERFRISIMATHNREDIDQLANVVEEVWNDPRAYG